MRRSSPIREGPRIAGVVKILETAQEEIQSNKLYVKTQIPFKVTFYKYLKYCKDKRLVDELKEFKNYKRGQFKPRVLKPIRVNYLINERGRQFLELVK